MNITYVCPLSVRNENGNDYVAAAMSMSELRG